MKGISPIISNAVLVFVGLVCASAVIAELFLNEDVINVVPEILNLLYLLVGYFMGRNALDSLPEILTHLDKSHIDQRPDQP